MVKQIQGFLVANAEWIGIDPGREQRVLDYACGHGTISLVCRSLLAGSAWCAWTDREQGVLKANPNAVCRGIDLDASQVERYNDEAGRLFADGGETRRRMFAVHGDLYHPSPEMTGPEWEGFDLAVISMALHHVKDPVDMLRRLKERLRPGGTLVVVEFLGKEEESSVIGKEYDTDKMVEVLGNQKIWPGFTTGNLEGNLNTAGFGGINVRVLDEPARIPENARGEGFGEEQWCFFAKAVVPHA